MKKTIKKLTITLVTVFALLGFGGTALATSGYIQWSGSEDFRQALENLNLINDRGQELKSERDTYYRENEQLVNQLKDKDNLINAKTQELDALRKENENLKKSSANDSKELKQAEKDVKTIKNKTDEVLNSLK